MCGIPRDGADEGARKRRFAGAEIAFESQSIAGLQKECDLLCQSRHVAFRQVME